MLLLFASVPLLFAYGSNDIAYSKDSVYESIILKKRFAHINEKTLKIATDSSVLCPH